VEGSAVARQWCRSLATGGESVAASEGSEEEGWQPGRLPPLLRIHPHEAGRGARCERAAVARLLYWRQPGLAGAPRPTLRG